MLVAEGDKAALKGWVVPKLESISDADAGVLAEYVIALIVAEDSEESVRNNCLDSLPDFLHDNTGRFIDEVLDAVKNKSYIAKTKAKPAPVPTVKINLLPSPALSAEAPAFNPPTGPSVPTNGPARFPGLGNNGQNGRADQSRKRRFNDRETSQPRDGQDPHYKRGPGADRPFKQTARRGGRNSRGGFGGQDMPMGSSAGHGAVPAPLPMFPNLPGMPGQPPGFPMNPADPMAFLAMMGIGFPGMPPLPLAGSPLGMAQDGQNGRKQPASRKGRCRDYDTKGYCALGGTCPYEHGGEIVLPSTAEEYDPNQSSLAVEELKAVNRHDRSRSRQDWGSKGGSNGGRTRRAPFSLPGPTNDRSNTTVVVEQIPEENFSEEAVRGFFSQFGNIVDVNMQAYKRLAVVEYDDHFAARRAYESPKVIFENRFVKVYWHRQDSLPVPSAENANAVKSDSVSGEEPVPYKQDEEMLDPEEVEKRQAEAQKAFEERQRKLGEAAAQREEVERKLKEKDEEMRRIRQKLAEKSKAKVANGDGSSNTEDAALIDQLSTLQAEAQDLGHTTTDYSGYQPRGRGGGRYRARGFYPPRGRGGFAPFRGGYRGRGFAPPPFAGGRPGVKRWDNRPKRLAVAGVAAGSQRDEALRQHLLSNYEYDSIDPHPDRADTQIVTFKERYVAEMFLGEALSDIPDLGKVELSWLPNVTAPSTTTPAPTQQPKAGPQDTTMSDQPVPSSDAKMEDEDQADKDREAIDRGDEDGEVNGNGGGGEAGGVGEADYDVADDEDRWMAA